MKRKAYRIMMAFAVVLLFVGCKGGDDEGITLSESQIVGLWQKSGTQEFWLYRADLSGAIWDANEGFSEDFPSYSYKWSVSGNKLRFTTYGEQIDVPITRTYTVRSISSTRMEREEEIGTYVLNKVQR